MILVNGEAVKEKEDMYLRKTIASEPLTFEIIPDGRTGSIVKRIYLQCKQFTYFIAEDGDFPNLKGLYLGFNQLTLFSLVTGVFPNLKMLDLPYNLLTSFSAKDGDFPNLKLLNLSSNQLTTFSAERISFPKLKYLYLYNNPNLEVLEISARNLKELWINKTGIRFLDVSLIKKITDHKKVKPHKHALGTKLTVNQAFHQGNPIVEEIVAHLTR